MAVGESIFPEMPPINGVKLHAISAGIKKNQQLDLILIELPESTHAAGVFTQNAFCAAPVTLCKQHLNQTINSRYLLINSGNANACTGDDGMQAAISSCKAISKQKNVAEENVLPFSTGVIGEPFPIEKIEQAIPELIAGLDENNWTLAAQGIMTTDTRPKGATRTITIDGETIVINGIAKGAGMIKPNMATMLAYIVTNAQVEASLLKDLVKEAADASFNRISIDGDTSTNDSCILAATGESNVLFENIDSNSYLEFKSAIIEVFKELAQAIVRDGEGATKFISIEVEKGGSREECLDVAYAIAHSPLVKTALFASDPNWGRIVAAIGYAGVKDLDANKVKVFLGDVLIVENGGRATTYTEEHGQVVMNQDEIVLRILLGRGDCKETLWTTDLSHEYIKINAEYRT
jgi:glutamate N-acetyltransferase/amino-acid N-acetyltransferase